MKTRPPRAWWKDKMWNVCQLQWNRQKSDWSWVHLEIDEPDECRYVLSERVKLLWPTGLQDKNGTEIYEGDITEILAEDGKKNRFVVRWGIARRVMDTGWQVDIPGFYFDLIGGQFQAFPIVKNYKGVHDLTMMEIVGNVYLNPDLLNILSLSKGKKESP